MTQIRILRERSDKTVIDIKGHAGFNPGNDIVCAGVSTLAYTLINLIQTMSERRELKEILIKDSSGDIHIETVHEDEQCSKWDDVVEFFITGIAMLEEHYPKHVNLSVS